MMLIDIDALSYNDLHLHCDLDIVKDLEIDHNID